MYMYKNLYRISLVSHMHVCYTLIAINKQLTKGGKPMKKNITVTDIEEIKFQADMIYGLSTIFQDYLDFTKQDEQLTEGLKCLTNESYKMKSNCYTLLEKYCADPDAQY